MRASSGWFLSYFDITLVVLIVSLFYKCTPVLVLGIATSLMNPGSFEWKVYLQTEMLIATNLVIFF